MVKSFKENCIDKHRRFYQLDQERKIKLYSQFIRKGDLCFDIGANYGDRSSIFLKLGAKVIAVEPVKECIDYMAEKFLGEMFQGKLIIMQNAVGSKNGVSIINVCSASAYSSMSPNYLSSITKREELKGLDWNEERIVKVISLNNLIRVYGLPEFCKIDVEGYELEALKTLKYKIPSLSMEFNFELLDTAIKCINKLSELGNYKFNLTLRENRFLLKNKWMSELDVIQFLKSLNKECDCGEIYARLRR